MRIGYDIRELDIYMGMGVYLRQLLEKLREYPDIEIFLFSDASIPEEFVELADRSIVCESYYESVWEDLILPGLLKEHKIDVLHNVRNFGLPITKKIPFILTLHDLTPLRYPELCKEYISRYDYRRKIKKSVRIADKIIAVSNSTKKDIARFLNVNGPKVAVVYEGVDPVFYNDSGDTEKRCDLPENYLLYVGNISGQKNFRVLVEVMALLPDSVNLVVACDRKYISGAVKNDIQKLGVEKRIHFIGCVSRKEIPSLYKNAKIFVFPSLYEGFGLILLEAMACGLPVVAFDNSSIPEVVGSGGMLVRDGNIKDFAGSIRHLLKNTDVYNSIKNAAVKQAQKFSWEKCASETKKIYDSFKKD